MKYSFHDSDENSKGTFTKNFEPKIINNDKVITDYLWDYLTSFVLRREEITF